MWILLLLTAFGKGDVNRTGNVSFNNRQQRDTKARQGSSTSPAARPPVRPGKCAAAPTSLVDGDNKALEELVECIREAEMRVSIKALFL